MNPIHVVGAGLAGCEASWQIARMGVPVVLHEMRPGRMTPAHRTDALAELVCSNSLRSDDALGNAVGLLHEEMRRAGSLILSAADQERVPAGSALAVDRERFSTAVSEAIQTATGITLRREEVVGPLPNDWDNVILATGPLTSPSLAATLTQLTGEGALAFFDAIAPIVHTDSIDRSIAWYQSRYDKGSGEDASGRDYLNCPLDENGYKAFVGALVAARAVDARDWEREDTPYFEGCLPIEVMATRGLDTLRFGPMKPVGLTDPQTGKRPYAVVQLRQDNALGTLFNLVGFQTRMRHDDQLRVLRMIPGLGQAEFARLGGIHRNTFINSPRHLEEDLRLRAMPRLRLAGQITGCEGYVESAAIGLLAGRFAAAQALGQKAALPPATTALGALLRHLTTPAHADGFQPMNINFGLFPAITGDGERHARKGRERKAALAKQALTDLNRWLQSPLHS